MKITAILFLVLAAANAHAEGKWSHESEVSVVTIRGNSKSETTSAKQSTKYTREKDSLTATAAYAESEAKNTTTGATETSAKSGNAGLRYDRVIDGKLSGFVGHEVYSDKFAGKTQEDRSTLGVSYQISKRDDQEWTAELGYVKSSFDYVGTDKEDVDALSMATAYSKKVNDNVTAGAKVKYRDAFADAEGTKTPLYWVDSEVNLAVVMSNLLSLKLAYETNYQNYKAKAPLQRRTDSKFTTALVAKF